MYKVSQASLETSWHFLIKLNMQLPYDPALALLGIYPREMKIYIHKYLYTNVHSSFIHNSPKLEKA